MDKLKIGDSLFYVPYTHRHKEKAKGHNVTITKIGRRWVQTDHLGIRFDKENHIVDGGQYSPPGRIYQSEEAYIETITVDELWGEIRTIATNYQKPDLTSNQLKDILNIMWGTT